jgi:ribosomal-protein-alanine N-acetyltransferase
MTPDEMTAIYAHCFPDRPWSLEEVTSLLNRRDVLPICAPNAFVMASCFAPEAEILTIAVAPAYRRKGIGAALLKELCAQLPSRDIDTVFLEVADGNLAAIGLYKGFDFQEVGRRKAYYSRKDAPAEDALVMRRALT